MSFKPGTPKPPKSGRKKGQKNTSTANITQLTTWLLSNYSQDQIYADFHELSARDRLDIITKLASKRVEIEGVMRIAIEDNPVIKLLSQEQEPEKKDECSVQSNAIS